jgi:RND family efflux transporter MFP subunit
VLALVRIGLLETPEPVEPAGEAAVSADGTVSFLMEQQWLVRMKLAHAESALLAPQVRAVGRVVPAPRHHAVVAPPVGGIVSTPALPQLGQRVRQGEIIARVTESPTAAEAASLRVEETRIEAERRRLTEARVEASERLDFSRSEAERARRLLERGAYAQRQADQAETEYRSAGANLAAVDAELAALEFDAVAMTYDVRSPISGTVVRVTKRAGERVGAGEAILEVIDTATVWMEVPVFERDLGSLSERPIATFTTPTFPGREFRTATVIDAGDVIDEDTRAAVFVFEVPNPDGLLRVGMQANVRMDAGTPSEALTVPSEAVLDNEGQKIVYVLLSGETFQRRTVTVGDEYGDRVAILSGLEPGDRVVTQGAYQLKLQELEPADPGAHTHEV